jgi:hypothetical protein
VGRLEIKTRPDRDAEDLVFFLPNICSPLTVNRFSRCFIPTSTSAVVRRGGSGVHPASIRNAISWSPMSNVVGTMRQARSRARYLRQRLVGEVATWRDNLAVVRR